jgi:serine/threonine-protein kinase
MAPEQARNELDPRSDVYSLGVLLYQCIAGKPPFTGKESIDIIVKHIREPVPPLTPPLGEIPDAARDLVMKCLEKEPVDRFQSMDEVLEALKAAGANAGYSGAFTDPRSPQFSTNTGSKPVKFDSRATKVPASPGETRAQATPGPGAGRHTESVEVSVSGLTGEKSRRNLFIAFTVIGLLVGGGGAFIAVNSSKPPPPKPIVVPPITVTPPPIPGTQKPPDLPPQPPSAEPVRVLFDLRSDPDGAKVTAKGVTLGETPLKHTVVLPSGATKASLEVTFTLDGYQSQTLTYEAESPGQLFEARLEKLKGTNNKKKKDPGNKQPPGYKESPY